MSYHKKKKTHKQPNVLSTFLQREEHVELYWVLQENNCQIDGGVVGVIVPSSCFEARLWETYSFY